MKLIPITRIPSGISGEDLAQIFASAQPGAAFSLPVGDGKVALLVLAAVREAQPGVGVGYVPPRRAALDVGLHAAISERILSDRANSVQDAAMQLVHEGRVYGENMLPESKANRLAKSYRAAHAKIPASAFDFQKLPRTQHSPRETINTIHEGETMHTTEQKALAPDRLHRITPRRFLIDLDKEGLSDARYSEILAPAFWIEGQGRILSGDIVTLVRSTGPTLDILIGPEHQDGGFYVIDLASLGRTVPPHPDLQNAEMKAAAERAAA